jgi:pimeloyl-ACP methyl ester carboxylesterase
MFERKLSLAGSWGADFHPDLQPQGDDIVLLPHKGTDVMNVDEFLSALDASPAGTVRPQVGDTVKGSDHGEIGEIEKIVDATDEHAAYMVVPRGLIFETDTYIPLEAVVRRSGSTVFVNVPKLVIGSMPWGDPPTRRDRRAGDIPTAELTWIDDASHFAPADTPDPVAAALERLLERAPHAG